MCMVSSYQLLSCACVHSAGIQEEEETSWNQGECISGVQLGTVS